MKQADFFLVIPAFNESFRLPPYLVSLAEVFDGADYKVVIQIVDDGSSQSEKERFGQWFEAWRKEVKTTVLWDISPMNQGKGGAVYRGWKSDAVQECNPKWLCFVDADGATPASEVARIFSCVKVSHDESVSFFASRVKMFGRIFRRSLWRHMVGRMFGVLVNLIIEPDVYDSQCGFKIVSRKAYGDIMQMLVEKGFAFDVELMAALRFCGWEIKELPVDWRDVEGSKVKIINDSWKMFSSLVKIKRNKVNWEKSCEKKSV